MRTQNVVIFSFVTNS